MADWAKCLDVGKFSLNSVPQSKQHLGFMYPPFLKWEVSHLVPWINCAFSFWGINHKFPMYMKTPVAWLTPAVQGLGPGEEPVPPWMPLRAVAPAVMLSLVLFPAKHTTSFSFNLLCEQLDQLLSHFYHDWFVFGEILLNKMWLSHTYPSFLSAGWNVNTSIGDSVLAPVFTEGEINKLLNLKPCILSSSRVHFGQGCQVFSCLWTSFEMTSYLRKTPSVCPHHLFLKHDSKVYCFLSTARICVREGQEWRTCLSFPSKARSYSWYLPSRHSGMCIAHVELHML